MHDGYVREDCGGGVERLVVVLAYGMTDDEEFKWRAFIARSKHVAVSHIPVDT
jgi:hypothetical protein